MVRRSKVPALCLNTENIFYPAQYPQAGPVALSLLIGQLVIPASFALQMLP